MRRLFVLHDMHKAITRTMSQTCVVHVTRHHVRSQRLSHHFRENVFAAQLLLQRFEQEAELEFLVGSLCITQRHGSRRDESGRKRTPAAMDTIVGTASKPVARKNRPRQQVEICVCINFSCEVSDFQA